MWFKAVRAIGIFYTKFELRPKVNYHLLSAEDFERCGVSRLDSANTIFCNKSGALLFMLLFGPL